MTIECIASSPRMSQAVIHDRTVYLSGQVDAEGEGVVAQTRNILAKIESLLTRTGSDKSRLLMATIWLADMAEFGAMNEVWDAWVADVPAPARATTEARLAQPFYRVEIAVIAAQG